MSVKILSSTLLAIIIVSALLINFFKSSSNPSLFNTMTISPSPSPRHVYIGAWVTEFWDNKSKTLNSQNLTSFEKTLEKKFAIANIYSDWAYLQNPKLIEKLNEISANGWTPMISSNPFFFKDCPDRGQSLYKTIAIGNCDEHLKNSMENLRNYNKPVFFRFAWEMNLPSMYWSVDNTKSSPANFIEAWRRFHQISKQKKADNVIWVLSFNTTNSVTTPYAELFPGDDYVDWVAIDGYNWGNTHPWAGWASFNGTFKQSYIELTALTDKPVMISEVNSAPSGTGGDKATWLTDMLETQIPKEFPNIQAIIIFNEDKTAGEKIDWRIETSPEYINALKDSFKKQIYKSDYP